MAILQSSLNEEILSRQERAIVRSIVHVSQLNEALIILNKVTTPDASYGSIPVKGRLHIHADGNVIDIKEYLTDHINEILQSTKVPASAPMKKITISSEVKG